MKENSPILLVEDDNVDAKSVLRSLKDLHVHNPVTRMRNGERALAWLRDPATTRPDLILLDLNMPIMNGLEFLQVIKGDPELRRIPVVILTTSQLESDRLATFDLSVAGYIVKPVGYGPFLEVVRTIDLYWTLSEPPSLNRA